MSELSDYYVKAQDAESPDGRDNAAGSGAYSKFQFMPATANAYAAKTPWGANLSPEQIKAAVTSDPTKARQLAELYTADSDVALKGAGLPVTDPNRFALHRFGPAGGVSLLHADANMPVADWVRSVQWGNGISPDAVIKQNSLDKFVNVGDLRSRFINAPMAGSGAPPQAAPAAPPAAPIAQPAAPAAVSLASLFGGGLEAPSFSGGTGWSPAHRRRA